MKVILYLSVFPSLLVYINLSPSAHKLISDVKTPH